MRLCFVHYCTQDGGLECIRPLKIQDPKAVHTNSITHLAPSYYEIVLVCYGNCRRALYSEARQPFNDLVFTSFHDGGGCWTVVGARLPSLASTSARPTGPRRVALVSSPCATAKRSWISSVLLRECFEDPKMNRHDHNGIINERIHSTA